MNLAELKTCLLAQPAALVAIILPEGRRVPPHYHVTEVGHVAKKFIDCGGTFRESEACVLQTWIGSARDDGHRLTAGKLARILDLARRFIPSEQLSIEVEYEDSAVTQFLLKTVAMENGELQLRLGLKHTDCLAREKCGCGGEMPVEEEDGGPGADEHARCCA